MKLIAELNVGRLSQFPLGKKYAITNDVRTLANGKRRSYEVVRTTPGDVPYDPHPFPKGLWHITGVQWQQDKGFDLNTYGLVKILTDAWQTVPQWSLDQYGDYKEETDIRVVDKCYWLHFSKSKTTLGCIRLDSDDDAIEIANLVQEALRSGEEVLLEVL
jgi:hypothetical protein